MHRYEIELRNRAIPVQSPFFIKVDANTRAQAVARARALYPRYVVASVNMVG